MPYSVILNNCAIDIPEVNVSNGAVKRYQRSVAVLTRVYRKVVCDPEYSQYTGHKLQTTNVCYGRIRPTGAYNSNNYIVKFQRTQERPKTG